MRFFKNLVILIVMCPLSLALAAPEHKEGSWKKNSNEIQENDQKARARLKAEFRKRTGITSTAYSETLSQKNKSKTVNVSSQAPQNKKGANGLKTKKSKSVLQDIENEASTLAKRKKAKKQVKAKAIKAKSSSDIKVAKKTIIKSPVAEEVLSDADYSLPYELEEVSSDGFALHHVGPFKNTDGRKYYEVLPSGEKVVLTLQPDLQMEAEELLRHYDLPYAAIVALEPKTGRILAMSGASSKIKNPETLTVRSSFPAASLFKMITAAAAVEKVGVNSNTPIKYRGGTYSLGKHNYLPNSKSDKLVMTLGQAMGKSCNPVFARVALNHLSPNLIRHYAGNFGFGQKLATDFPLSVSTLTLDSDGYSLARTAAGFGAAYISPVHAAAMVGAFGNQGVMMRPHIVDGVVLRDNKIRYLNNGAELNQVVQASTSEELLNMMQSTVSTGTARRHFRLASPTLKNINVAAKTGTLRGPNPKGIYHWFAAVAPVENPQIAISALVIDNGGAKLNGVGLGRRFLEKAFSQRDLTERAQSSGKGIKPVS